MGTVQEGQGRRSCPSFGFLFRRYFSFRMSSRFVRKCSAVMATIPAQTGDLGVGIAACLLVVYLRAKMRKVFAEHKHASADQPTSRRHMVEQRAA